MKIRTLEDNFSKRTLWWLFVMGYFLMVYAPRFIMEGMFGDGLTYSSIGRNMALGLGSFWAPYFSSSFWLPFNTTKVFYEHPPLAMYLQSLLFRLFGDQLFVEKLYSFLICLSTVLGIVLIWRLILKETHWVRWDWLPVIIWLGMPEVEWTVPNNMLDNTQAMFCVFGVYFFIVATFDRSSFLMALISGCCIFMGFLSKGPVSFFVIVFPFLFFFIGNNKSKVFFNGLGLILGLILPLLFCYYYPPARLFLTRYINQQFLSALLGNREIADSSDAFWGHFYIFKSIYNQIFTGIIFIILVFGLIIWKKGKAAFSFITDQYWRFFWVFTVFAISGSFPIALSSKQADYYLLPSTPFYAISIAILGVILFKVIENDIIISFRKRLVFLSVLAYLFISLGYASYHIGKVRKYEKDIIHDLPILAKYIPKSSKIWVCPEMMNDFTIHTYLQRYLRAELTLREEDTKYFLSQINGCSPPSVPSNEKKEPFERFRLFVVKE